MTEAQRRARDSKDGKALTNIILNIKSSQVIHVKHCLTSKSAWDSLKKIHQLHGPARKITLFKQLLHMKLGEKERMPEYVNRFTDVVEKLSEN